MQLGDALRAQPIDIAANRVVAENRQGYLRCLVAREVCWQVKPAFAGVDPHALYSGHNIRSLRADDQMGDCRVLISKQGLQGDNDA
jgi:hypothetical protein